jgi:hypothetical protein
MKRNGFLFTRGSACWSLEDLGWRYCLDCHVEAGGACLANEAMFRAGLSLVLMFVALQIYMRQIRQIRQIGVLLYRQQVAKQNNMVTN